jgi:hypothetical protein
LITAVVALALTFLTACDKSTPNATPTAVTTLGTPTQQPTGTATTSPTPAETTTTTAPPTGPRIVYFRTKGSARCQSGGPGASYPGSVELEWEVAGGPTGVTLSIDGPGIYNSYPIKHSEIFNFSCDATPNKISKHTYLLKTVGGPEVKQQTLVVEAKYIGT